MSNSTEDLDGSGGPSTDDAVLLWWPLKRTGATFQIFPVELVGVLLATGVIEAAVAHNKYKISPEMPAAYGRGKDQGVQQGCRELQEAYKMATLIWYKEERFTSTGGITPATTTKFPDELVEFLKTMQIIKEAIGDNEYYLACHSKDDMKLYPVFIGIVQAYRENEHE